MAGFYKVPVCALCNSPIENEVCTKDSLHGNAPVVEYCGTSCRELRIRDRALEMLIKNNKSLYERAQNFGLIAIGLSIIVLLFLLSALA
jgi:hypothetical protein